MFKENGSAWLYLLGVAIMLGILGLISFRYIVPVIYGDKDIDTDRFRTEPEFTINTADDYIAEVNTNFGQFTIDLYEKNAPNNVNNFVSLATTNYYEDVKFHRLIPSFLLQGGDRNTTDDDLSDDGFGHPGYFIQDEVNWDSLNLSEERRDELSVLGYSSTNGLTSKSLTTYSVAMANAGPNTNGSQFFIVLASPADSRLEDLQGQYTVIGEVIAGKDIIDSIANTPVDNPVLNSPRPTTDVIISQIDIFTR